MATFNVDVDDMIYEMSSYEKQEMANALYDDNIIPKALQHDFDIMQDRIPNTTTEFELHEILDTLWDNRNNINSSDLRILRTLAKK